MTTEITAIILGAVQGLTEFLPVSSSGHLVFLQTLLGWNDHTLNLFFDIVLHAGTLVAVLLVLRQPIQKLVINLKDRQLRPVWLLALGTMPVVIITLLFIQFLIPLFSGGWQLSLAFLISALWLVLSQKLDQPSLTGRWTKLTYRQAIFIGCFQALALIPGISRSGSTFIAGLIAQLKPAESYTFSFLLLIPAILGALVYQFVNLPSNLPIPPSVIILGFSSALIFGIIGLTLWDRIIVRQKYWVLAVYLVVLATINLALTQ